MCNEEHSDLCERMRTNNFSLFKNQGTSNKLNRAAVDAMPTILQRINWLNWASIVKKKEFLDAMKESELK